jgi:hypothetical protein
MTELEGFDSRYGAVFADLVTLARALGAGADAEDVAQEALLEARGHLKDLRDPDKLRAWVRRIAIRGAVATLPAWTHNTSSGCPSPLFPTSMLRKRLQACRTASAYP